MVPVGGGPRACRRAVQPRTHVPRWPRRATGRPEAARWFRLAAEQGDARAQHNLGVHYSDGRGVPQDDAEAVRWYRLAADQGHAGAQFSLGYMYGSGEGVPQDDMLAYIWSSLAVASVEPEYRDDAVHNRDLYAARLTPSQRAEAQRLAREWTRSDATPSAGVVPGATENVRPPAVAGGTGTAFIVHPDGLLLTAHHVIERATSITVSCNGQPAVPATVAANSPTIDLALLEAAGDLGTASFLRLSPARVPSLGDRVFTIGYPTPSLLGPDPKYTNGTVSALSGPRGDASFLQISVPIQPGNSGGPLVNAETGDVVGVVVATADAPVFIEATDSIPQNINWAVKSVFASALFAPPSDDVTSATDSDDVIARVTEATCLVEARRPAQPSRVAARPNPRTGGNAPRTAQEITDSPLAFSLVGLNMSQILGRLGDARNGRTYIGPALDLRGRTLEMWAYVAGGRRLRIWFDRRGVVDSVDPASLNLTMFERDGPNQ